MQAKRNIRGNAFQAAGQAASVSTAWERCLALRPDDAAACISLGRALIEAGRPADAFRHLKAGCKRHPADPQLLAPSGKALLRLGHHEAALGALFLAIDFQPNSADLHADLSTALAAVGDLDQAAAHALTAFRLAPSAQHATNASCALIGLGSFTDALAMADRAITA